MDLLGLYYETLVSIMKDIGCQNARQRNFVARWEESHGEVKGELEICRGGRTLTGRTHSARAMAGRYESDTDATEVPAHDSVSCGVVYCSIKWLASVSFCASRQCLFVPRVSVFLCLLVQCFFRSLLRE